VVAKSERAGCGVGTVTAASSRAKARKAPEL
jgi:hypothetical protein